MIICYIIIKISISYQNNNRDDNNNNNRNVKDKSGDDVNDGDNFDNLYVNYQIYN